MSCCKKQRIEIGETNEMAKDILHSCQIENYIISGAKLLRILGIKKTEKLVESRTFGL